MRVINTKDQEFKDNYKLLIGSILPRPIAFVSTRNKDGSNNLAPFSFFTAISADPMIVAFCPLIRTSTGEKKDTLINIEREKECVINFVTEDNAHKANLTSTELAYGEDEFDFAGLNALDSEVVKAKRVKESPIHFECILRDFLNYGEHIGSGTLIALEVLRVHISDDIYDEGRIVTSKFRPMGRGAGNDWFSCSDPVIFERLMASQIQK